jgi:hypothetical protein
LQAAGGVIVTLSEQPFDIRSMMDGSKPIEPLLISTPALTSVLLHYIRVKGSP